MIRKATPADVPHLLRCIRELARYEKLEHEVVADRGQLHEHLFGANPACAALVAEVPGPGGPRQVGFALYYRAYSTFKQSPYIHLEDLFVDPEFRGKGLGLALLRALAAEAVALGYPRLGWNVLDWNQPAIDFYRAHGAEVLKEWRVVHLSGDALRAAARAAGG